jgi:hypothetical protein
MRRVLRVALLSVLGIIALLVLLAGGARLYFSDSRIKSLLEAELGEALDSRVEIGSLDISGFLGMNLSDIAFKDVINDSSWFTAARVNMRLRLWSLFSGQIHIERMSVTDSHINYALIPEADSVPGTTGQISAPSLPLELKLDSLLLSDIRVIGPGSYVLINLALYDVFYDGPDKFTLSYYVKGIPGSFQFVEDSVSVNGHFRFRAAGNIDDSSVSKQRFSLTLDDLEVTIGEKYNMGRIDVAAVALVDPSASTINLDTLLFYLNREPLVRFTADIDLGPRMRAEVNAYERQWDVASFAALVERLGVPLIPRGTLSLNELSLIYTPAGLTYDFAVELGGIGFDFGDELKVDGINGEIYSDGDLGEIIFGSSLTVDTARVISPEGSVIRFEGISSAVEAEFSESEYSLNITSGIVGFMGGKLDLTAFSHNSELAGRLKISDLNLADISSSISGDFDTVASGLLDLTVDLEGTIDSISAILRAHARDLTLIAEKDTVALADQDIEVNSTILLNKRVIKSSFDYSLGSLMAGTGQIDYPLLKSAEDSLVVAFDLDIDNSLLPEYFPPSLVASLGPVDIFGRSDLDGRLATPADTFIVQGSSKLSIRPTDLLMEDYQSLIFQLVSLSEVEINEKGIEIMFEGGIGELYAEEYSDLPFPEIELSGEVVSTSDTTWELTDAGVFLPSINSQISISGDFGFAQGESFSHFDISGEFLSDEPVLISSMVSVEGAIGIAVRIDQRGDLLIFGGEASINDLFLAGAGAVHCNGITGRIPFYGTIDLGDSLFVGSERGRSPARSTYIRNRLSGESAGSYGRVEVQAVAFEDIAATNIELDILFADGILEIPYITSEILGGDFVGDLECDFSGVNILREYPDYENMKYAVSYETAELDFNQLVYGFGPFESRAEFTSAARFQGRGIPAPGEEYTVDGMFHIFNMGSQVVDRVLDFIDPENQNPGVVQTRKLLNKKLLGVFDMSYKPKEFIVEIKHGALYPALYMSQPFFADFIPLMRIPMPVRYGRLPLNAILEGMEER